MHQLSTQVSPPFETGSDPERQNRELRRAMRDLVALASMPAAWVGRDPGQVAKGMLDLLVSTLRLDAAYVRLNDSAGGAAVEVQRSAGWPEFEAWLPTVLESRPVRKPDHFGVPILLRGGSDELRATLCPIGVDAAGGVVAVGSRRPDFPTEMDLLLLSVATNQAAIAFDTARLMEEQLRAETELRRSKAELEDFVENANVGLHWVGPDGVIIWANQAELELLGYRREEYIGHSIAEFHVDAPVIQDMLSRLRCGEELRDYEARMRAKDGSVRHVIIRSSAYREGGRFVHSRCFTLDVTARKLIELEQRKLIALVENSPNFVGVAGLDQKPIFLNRAGRQLVGIESDDELRSSVILDYFSEEERPRVQQEIMPELLAKGRWDGEVNFRHFRSAERVPVMWNVFLIPDPETGAPAYFACVSTDLRERKRAEQELASKHVLLRTVTHNATASLFFMDPDGRCTFMNPAAEKMTGFSLQEIVQQQEAGRTLHDIIHHTYPDGRHFPISECPIDRALPEIMEVQGYEAVFIRKDGSFYPVVCSASPILEGGRPLGTVIEVRDVTAERAAQAALRLNEERLRAALAASNAGTFRWDIATNRLWWDDNLHRLFGLEPTANVDRLEILLQAVHPDDVPAVTAALERSARLGHDFDLEFRIVWPDTSIHWLLDRGRMFFDSDGRPTYMAGACMDITERKRAEQALRDSEKLAATGRLAATIAHEINNPLESVTNLIYLVKGDPSLSQEARRELEIADQELARITHIAQQTLGFYRDTSDPAAVNLADLLEDVLSLYARRLGYKNIRVAKDLRGPARVYCQAGEIRQVFSNLFANAIDASPRDGVLRVRMAPARRQGTGEKGICVTIADCGSGIAPQHRSRIFQPFFTTKKTVGTGLGLWVTKTMIENHHGSIRFRSSTAPARSGTIFRVFLPEAGRAPALQ